MAYDGPDRRRGIDPELYGMLARIDERTSLMAKTMETLATCERVDSVEKKLDDHIASHDKKGGRIAEWAAIAVSAAFGIFGIMKAK